MKKINFFYMFLMIFFIAFVFTGCSKLSGLYESDDSGLIKSIKFSENGTCTMRDSMMGIPTSYKYKVQGKTVIIEMGGGVGTLSIESNNSLEGMGLPFTSGQIFIKK